MINIECQCCFCGEGIEESAAGASRLDPCAVVLVVNWKKSEEEQASQQFFCHLACFKKSVGRNAPVDVELLIEDGEDSVYDT